MTVEHYEFGGPVLGPVGIMVMLPAVVYGLFSFCPPAPAHFSNASAFKPQCPGLSDLDASVQRWRADHAGCLAGNLGECLPVFSMDAFVVVVGWLAFQALLERTLPSAELDGVVLNSGKRLKYRLNGLLCMFVTFIILFFGKVSYDDGKVKFDRLPLEWLYDNYVQTITASLIVSYLLSIAVYAASFRPGAELAEGGDSGWAIYDFFIGRELNPRIPGTTFDVKFFCELRPGLIGWVVLNVAFALKERELSGAEYPSPAMIMINVFQAIYVIDALVYEPAVLTTMDITTDGFGFMLAFGDLCWVPFTYSLQARYLVTHPGISSTLALTLVFLLNFAGYFIFRGANGEKDAFRRNPSAPECRHLEYMDTKRGTRLLVSGWWGLARKINYTGDWLMGLAWCLVTGFDTVITYFYAIYFAVLLVHRAIRDDEMCQRKYGDDWARYKSKVPYVFFPFSIAPTTLSGTLLLWATVAAVTGVWGSLATFTPQLISATLFVGSAAGDEELVFALRASGGVALAVGAYMLNVLRSSTPTQAELTATASVHFVVAFYLLWSFFSGAGVVGTAELGGMSVAIWGGLAEIWIGSALLLAPSTSA
mmetsp:Transcript_8598/g.22198  ORF Transcript_8598/g.22198 Transcript_8598/m.22198 type:complete len:593 (-) Transcript_8598:61-1839(-)